MKKNLFLALSLLTLLPVFGCEEKQRVAKQLLAIVTGEFTQSLQKTSAQELRLRELVSYLNNAEQMQLECAETQFGLKKDSEPKLEAEGAGRVYDSSRPYDPRYYLAPDGREYKLNADGTYTKGTTRYTPASRWGGYGDPGDVNWGWPEATK